ncbi:MAG TPA: hypothetical protein VIF09_29175 [Polyangiaceae bacterium]|jgi:hypothetical protein
MSDDVLLDLLPPEAKAALLLARDTLARARAGETKCWVESLQHAEGALAAIGIPDASGPMPLASAYDDVQRAALAWCAIHEVGMRWKACPRNARTIRRWLGIDAPGVLESRTVTLEHEGATTTEPLWRALQMAGDPARQAAILDSLPCEVALAALGELHLEGIGYGIDFNQLFGRVRVLHDLKDEGRDWAIAQAEAFPRDAHYMGSHLKAYVFLALARAGVPIEERWEHLYPNVMGASRELLFECARALPEGRRAAALAPQLASMQVAVDLVAEFPTADMVGALLGGVEANSVRWSWLVEQMRELGKGKPAVRDAVEAIVAATPKPMDLYVTATKKPTDAAELSSLEHEQLRIAGKGYDQKDLDAEARLAKDDGDETSFRGFFEVRSIADAGGNPAYDALLYMVDSGSIYRAGTTEEVGWVAQGGVVLKEKNDALRLALQVAVGRKPLRRKAKKTASKKPKK